MPGMAFARHGDKRYKELMGRVNNFIVTVRKKERQLRQAQKKDKDPFETGKGEQIQIMMNMKYSETDEPIRCHPREIRKDECGGDHSPHEVQEVINFISRIQWDPNIQDEGGDHVD